MLGAIKSGDDSGKTIIKLPEDVNAFSNNLTDEILPILDTMEEWQITSLSEVLDSRERSFSGRVFTVFR